MVPPAPSLPKDFSQLSLAEAAELLVARKLPPVEQWHPERTGDSAMEIRADGSWYHEGGRINRPAMVKLFSTILRREADGSHVSSGKSRRSEEHTSELQSLMRISYAVFCLTKKKKYHTTHNH